MADNTKVLLDNCVSAVEIPDDLDYANGFDYNPTLNLYATFNYDDGVSVWDPVRREVVAEFNDLGENFRDVFFLPGNRLGVSSAEYHHGGVIQIYNLGKDKCQTAALEIDEELPMSYPGMLALSPEKSLIVTDPFNSSQGVYEIFMDWDQLKVLESREIIPGDEDAETGNWLLCCSQDFRVATSLLPDEASSVSTAKVCFDHDGQLQIEEQETITYYVLDGEKKNISRRVTGFVYDEESLIIANDHEIVLLDTIAEGSNAHLIVSQSYPSGQIRLNTEGQLMVCHGSVIELFEYKCRLRRLQDLCRHSIRSTIQTGYADKVESFPIPYTMKDYLLYK